MAGWMSIKVGGKDVTAEIARAEYAEALDQLDQLVLELRLSPFEDPKPIVDGVAVGEPFVVELKDGDSVVTKGEGDIVEVTHAVDRTGTFRITAVGLDGLHRLDGTQPAQVWEASHQKIVQEIAKRHRLKAVADGVSTTPGFEVQANLGDAVFLRNLAREHNYYVRVSAKELHFKRTAPSGKAVALGWREDVVEAQSRSCLRGLATTVTVHGYDPTQEKAFVGKATSSDLTKISGGDVGADLAKKAFGVSEIILNQAGYVASSNAKERAKAELQRRAERFVEGTFVTDGRPDAVSGRKVTVTEAPWPFMGPFLIRQTRHVTSAHRGFRTYIDFVSDSLPKKK